MNDEDKKEIIFKCLKALMKFHMENYNRRIDRTNDDFINNWIENYLKENK